MSTASAIDAARLLHVSVPAVSRLLSRTGQRLAYHLLERSKARPHPSGEERRNYQQVDPGYDGVRRIGGLPHTAVSAVLPSNACVACVCRIQCGVARRSFSAPVGQSSSKTDAVVAKSRFMMPLSRVAVIPAWPSRQPMIGVPGDHFEGVTAMRR